MATIKLKNEVIVKFEEDGYWRAFWAHRQWDCVKHDSRKRELFGWLKARGFVVVK